MRQTYLVLFIFCNSYTLFAQLPSYVPNANLIGWWAFSNNLLDSSGNNNNGSGAQYLSTNDRNGNANQAYNFSNSTSYVQFSNLPINLAGNYTINYWMNLTSYNDYDVIMDIHPSNICSSYPQIWEKYDSLFIVKCNNVPSKVSIGHKSVFLNTWNMVTNAIRADTTFIYINGTLLKKFPYTWGTSTNSNIVLANCYNSSYNYALGSKIKIDDLGLWNRELSECEIWNLYNSALLNFTLQPVSQSVLPGTNVTFTVNTNLPVTSYQWQMDNGTGFINLSNAGPYNGVTTNTLNISNVTFSSNNNYYRCIVKTNSNCIDTSSSAILTTFEPEAISSLNYLGKSKLFQNTPNPFTNSTIINYFIYSYAKSAFITLCDIQGRSIINQNIEKLGAGEFEIDQKFLKSGLYFYSLIIDGIHIDSKKLVLSK